MEEFLGLVLACGHSEEELSELRDTVAQSYNTARRSLGVFLGEGPSLELYRPLSCPQTRVTGADDDKQKAEHRLMRLFEHLGEMLTKVNGLITYTILGELPKILSNLLIVYGKLLSLQPSLIAPGKISSIQRVLSLPNMNGKIEEFGHLDDIQSSLIRACVNMVYWIDEVKSVPSYVTPPRDVYSGWFCKNCTPNTHRQLPNGPYISAIYEGCCNCESPRSDTLDMMDLF